MLHVRLSGTEKGVRGAIAQLGGDEVSHASEFWDSVRDQTHVFFRGGPCYRVALPPAAAYPALEGEWLTEWAGAQRWFRARSERADVDAMTRSLGGWAAKFSGADISQRLDPGALKYHRRLKQAFDPMALFNRASLFSENGRAAAPD